MSRRPATGPVSISIPGGRELMRRLQGALLVQPEIESAVETITKRPLRTKGSKIGVKRNRATITATSKLGRRIHSTGGRERSPAERDPKNVREFNPRVTGAAWDRFNVKAMRAVAKRAIKAAYDRMKARLDKPLPKD